VFNPANTLDGVNSPLYQTFWNQITPVSYGNDDDGIFWALYPLSLSHQLIHLSLFHPLHHSYPHFPLSCPLSFPI
jgi:hypothetical protein